MESNKEDFQYFIDNHDKILEMYPNKFVVIKDKKVLFADDTFEGALEKAVSDGHDVGTFLIQECTEGDSAYTQTYHSRAIFV